MRRILPSEVPNQCIRCVAELNFDYVWRCIARPHGDVGECTRRAEILFTVNLDGLRAELIPFRVLEPAEIAAEFSSINCSWVGYAVALARSSILAIIQLPVLSHSRRRLQACPSKTKRQRISRLWGDTPGNPPLRQMSALRTAVQLAVKSTSQLILRSAPPTAPFNAIPRSLWIQRPLWAANCNWSNYC